MIEIKEPFKDRFKKALEYRNIKPADMARKSGLSESTISQYRSGYSKPKEERLVLLANILDVNPSWLMGLDVPMEKNIIEVDTYLFTPGEKNARPVIDVSNDELTLLTNFRFLNSIGQKKVMEDVEDMAELPKYTKKDNFPDN